MMANGEARTFDHCYSPATVFDIRYSVPTKHESNQQHVQRLMKKYGLTLIECRLLIEAPSVDAVGRLIETKQ